MATTKHADLLTRLRDLAASAMPLPGGGQTAERHARLMAIGREDLSLARLAEAHFDAVAILAEAGREAGAGVIYGVWASEKPGQAVSLDGSANKLTISGSKMFCSGVGIVDRALVTVGEGSPQLVDVDLRDAAARGIRFDFSDWKTQAFLHTGTASVTFSRTPVTALDLVEALGWYLSRPGFWYGACGPAACWAGGAEGLLDFALSQKRNDPHTLAHLGAMHAAVWALRAYLDAAGREIDQDPANAGQAYIRALSVRHLVEQAGTDILRRLARAYGPAPMAMNAEISMRYQELDLYLRQSHAERDLEALGRAVLRL